MLLYTFQAKVTTCEPIAYVIETLSEVVISTPIVIYKWFNKPRIRHTKKHRKTNNNSGKFSHNFCARKKACYNKRNCKSGRHSPQYTFMKRKSRTNQTTTNNTNQNLKIKGKKLATFKSPLLEDLTVCSEPLIVGVITKVLTILNIILHCTTGPTYVKIIYPWNKAKMIGLLSASPGIVSSDIFFQIPTHSKMWSHGRRLYDYLRNQGV